MEKMNDLKLDKIDSFGKEELKELLILSYKKLKSDTYYDNSNLFLRKQIAESENDIDKLINKICEETLSKNKSREDITVDFHCLPKKVNSKKSEKSSIVCNELDISEYTIDKVTYFIDLDLKYHILGTAWVLLAGKKLLEQNEKYIYGRKLDKNHIKNDIRLFKPYHKEYSKWRDKAIMHSEHFMDNEDRCLMIALDIKDYYYSVDIKFKDLLDELELNSTVECSDNKISKVDLIIKLTNQIEQVCSQYSLKIFNISSDKKKCILPIGYIPSSILANWYLAKLDIDVCKNTRPIYYGRYIDDMIIVLPYTHSEKDVNQAEIINEYFCKTDILTPALIIKNNSENYKYLFYNYDELYTISNENVLRNTRESKVKKCRVEYYINNILNAIDPKDIEFKENLSKVLQERFNINNINIYCEKFNIDLKSLCIEDLIKIAKVIIGEIEIKCKNIERVYLLKNKLQITSNTTPILAIQNTKIKIYDFKPGGSKAIIENFKKELKKNASIFKFLPEKDIVVNSFDEEVLEIIYSEGINKIRSIENFKVNKYNLSKFLAQVIYSEKLDNDIYSRDLDKKVLNLFKGMNGIEFYSLWEKAMTCYLMNDNKEYISLFIKNISKEIDSININQFNLNFNIYKHKHIEEINNKLKVSLRLQLECAIALIWSLNDDIFVHNKYINNNTFDKENVIKSKEDLRISNMIRHSNLMEPLMNYTNIVSKAENREKLGLDGLNLVKNQCEKDSINFGFRCTILNDKINRRNVPNEEKCGEKCKLDNSLPCIYEISEKAQTYSPRYVHLHEIILYKINTLMTQGTIVSGIDYINESIKEYKTINNLNENIDFNFSARYLDNSKDEKLESKGYKSEEKNKFSIHINDGNIKKYSVESQLFNQSEIDINLINVKGERNKNKLKIALAHIEVLKDDYKESIFKTPNLQGDRLQRLYCILNQAVKQNADMLVLPELSVPHSWLSVISNFSRKHQLAIICGLEHVVYENKVTCNYLATILPGKYNDYTYSIVKLRIKNHYAPAEIEQLRGYGLEIPKMIHKYNRKGIPNKNEFIKEYDLFRWRGIDFSCYNCFELSSLNDRGLFMSYVDLLIGSVHNKDVNHHSNIIESLSRDVHSYFVQVNNSKYGDNRIVAPKKTEEKNILQITGGINDTVLVGEIDIKSLREFQLQDYNLQLTDKTFKPTPPEFNKDILKLRMNKPL